MKIKEWREALTQSITTQRDLRRIVTKSFLVPALKAGDPVWAEIRTSLDDEPPVGRFATDNVLVGAYRINDSESMPSEMMSEQILTAFLRVKGAVRLWEEGVHDAFPNASQLELLDGETSSGKYIR